MQLDRNTLRRLALIAGAILILAASVMASSLTSISTYTNPDGLIAYWDFAQCTSTSATDRGDWGNTGTLTNSPTWVAGKYGCGINFAGGGYVHASNNSILNPSTITISIWAYRTGTDALAATYTLITKNNGGATPYYGIGIYAGGLYATANGNPVLSMGTEAATLPLNTWVHLAMTEDGSTLKAYVNGVLYSSQSSAMTGATTTNLSIGGGAAPFSFAGVLDEPKIWNRALSSEEVYVDYLGTYANIEKYYQGLTTANITAAQNLIIGNITSANSSLAALLATLQAEVISVNTTQNSNYATLQVEILNTNTTQNSNYAAMTTLLNQLGINITSVNTTQNTNANNIIALLNAIGLNVTSVNQTMLDNFTTLYTITVQINGTVNGIKVDLAQMNGTLNTMSSNLAAMNTTIVDTQTKLNDTYTLLQALSINSTAHNATMAAYYSSLIAALQGMNTTLNGVDANLSAHNSTIVALLNGIGQNLTSTNSTAVANFLLVYADLQQMNTTLNSIAGNLTNITSNLTAAQIAIAVWNFTHRTLTPLNATVLTVTSSIDWHILKGYATTLACTSNQHESNATLYFDNIAVGNPYTIAPDLGSWEVRCESPQSENFSAGITVAYLNVTMGGTGGTTGNGTNGTGSLLVGEATAQPLPDQVIVFIFVKAPTFIYNLLLGTLLGLGLWVYAFFLFAIIFICSIASKKEIKSLNDVPMYGQAAILLAVIIVVVYALVPLAVK